MSHSKDGSVLSFVISAQIMRVQGLEVRGAALSAQICVDESHGDSVAAAAGPGDLCLRKN